MEARAFHSQAKWNMIESYSSREGGILSVEGGVLQQP